MFHKARPIRVIGTLLMIIAAFISILVTVVNVEAKDNTQRATAQATATNTAKAVAVATSNSQLKALVDTFSASYPDKVNVVVTDLSNGATASTKADQQVVSASIYKLFVAYDIYKQIDEGTITLDQDLSGNESGQTVDGCLNLMITVSDNDCGVALGEIDGWAQLDSLLKSEGYTGTFTNNYDSDGNVSGDKLTTAHDVALLLQRLYQGTLLSAASSADFLNYLKNDQINNYLPTGLPAGTVIAHKIGDLYGYIHDAGIIYGPKKDTIVVLLSGEWDNPATDAPPVFAQLSSTVWDYMQE